MDAHALLTSQGWRGTGHSLHPTSDSNGLSKPLLVSRKDNVLGLGKKQHRTSDMWWMNAFDSSLKGLDTSVQGQVVQTNTGGGLDMVARGGGKYVGKKGLYASFVRGECLSGTLTPEEVEAERLRIEAVRVTVEVKASEEGGKKRKREERESKEERRAKKVALKAVEALENFAVKAPKVESSTGSSDEVPETKEERKARKAAKRAAKEQSVIIEIPEKIRAKDIETKDERKERRLLEKLSLAEPQKEIVVEEVQTIKPETKEERKERRRLKKLAQDVEESDPEDLSEKSKKKHRKD